MRLVIRPATITRPSMLQGDSNYVTLRNFGDHLDRVSGEKHFYYYVMSDKYTDMLEDTHNIKHIYFPSVYFDFNHFQRYSPLIVGQLFNRRYGKWLCDAYITESSAEAWGTDNLLGAGDRRVPIIMEESKAMYPGYSHDECSYGMMEARAFGYACSVNLFDSEMEKQIAMRLCRDFLKPDVMRKVMAQSHVIPCGVDAHSLGDLTSVKKNRKFTILFGGRANATKNTDALLKVLERASVLYDFDVLLTTQMDSPKKVRKKYPNFKFFNGVQCAKYQELVAKAHCYITASVHEGYSVSTAEAIFTNTITLLPDRYWVTDETYKGCPFVYALKKPDEAISMIKHIMDNYDTSLERFNVYRKEFMAGHGRDDATLKAYHVIKDAVNASNFMCLKEDRLRCITDGWKRDGMTEFYLDTVERHYAGKVNNTSMDDRGSARFIHAFPGRYDYYRSLIEYGIAEDCCDDPNIRMRLL